MNIVEKLFTKFNSGKMSAADLEESLDTLRSEKDITNREYTLAIKRITAAVVQDTPAVAAPAPAASAAKRPKRVKLTEAQKAEKKVLKERRAAEKAAKKASIAEDRITTRELRDKIRPISNAYNKKQPIVVQSTPVQEKAADYDSDNWWDEEYTPDPAEEALQAFSTAIHNAYSQINRSKVMGHLASTKKEKAKHFAEAARCEAEFEFLKKSPLFAELKRREEERRKREEIEYYADEADDSDDSDAVQDSDDVQSTNGKGKTFFRYMGKYFDFQHQFNPNPTIYKHFSLGQAKAFKNVWYPMADECLNEMLSIPHSYLEQGLDGRISWFTGEEIVQPYTTSAEDIPKLSRNNPGPGKEYFKALIELQFINSDTRYSTRDKPRPFSNRAQWEGFSYLPTMKMHTIKAMMALSADQNTERLLMMDTDLVRDFLSLFNINDVVFNSESMEEYIFIRIVHLHKAEVSEGLALNWGKKVLKNSATRRQTILSNSASQFITNDFICREEFYMPNACLINIFLERYHDIIKADPRYKDHDLSHAAIYKFCTGLEIKDASTDGKGCPMTLDQLTKILAKYKIAMKAASKFSVGVMSYKPNCAKSMFLPGGMLRLIVHDGHCWLADTLTHAFDKIDVVPCKMEMPAFTQATATIALSPKWHHVKPQKEMAVSVRTVEDLVHIGTLEKDLRPRSVIYVGKTDSTNQRTLFDFLVSLNKLGFQPSSIRRSQKSIDSFVIKMTNDWITTVRLPFTCMDTGTQSDFAFEDCSTSLQQFNISSWLERMRDCFMPRMGLSTYNPKTLELFCKFQRNAIVSTLNWKLANANPTNHHEFDISRAYTSYMAQIEKIPVLSYFDIPIEYDDSPILPYRFYCVITPIDKILFTDENSFVTGEVLIYADKVGIPYKIKAMLIPSEEIEIDATSCIKSLYLDPLINQASKKLICNIAYGSCTKMYNSIFSGEIFADKQEASASPGRIIETLPDDNGYIRWQRGRSILTEGYLPVSRIILDKSRINMHKMATCIGFENVIMIRVDAIYVPEKEAEACTLRLKQQFRFASDSDDMTDSNLILGSLKSAAKNGKIVERSGRFYNLFTKEMFKPAVQPDLITMVDEKSTEEFDSIAEKYRRLTILGKYPGVGKSYSTIQWCARNKKKLIGICATNAQCDKLVHEDKVEAMTLHHIMGENPNAFGAEADETDSTPAENHGGVDLSSYDCIMFEESMLHNVTQFNWIQTLCARYPTKNIHFNGDSKQNAPISMNLADLVTYDEFSLRALKSMSDAVLTLSIIKRVDAKNADDVTKIMYLMDSLETGLIPKKEILATLTHIDISDLPTSAAYMPHVVALNSTVALVNKWCHAIRYPGDPIDKFVVGQRMLGSGSCSTVGGKIASNQAFIVKAVTDTHVTVYGANGKDRVLTLAKARVNLKRDYAMTCSSIQGATLPGDTLYVHDCDSMMASNVWLRTAFSRCKHSNIVVVTGSSGMTFPRNRILANIASHLRYDNDNAMPYIIENYVSYEWVKYTARKQHYQCVCSTPLDGHMSIDRIKNNIGHIRTNCRLVCNSCQCASNKR